MSAIYKTSAARIIRPEATRLIRLMSYANPEQILPPAMQEYFLELGYSSMYPNFKHIRIGAVHPFALLLFQESLGQKLDLSVFPSITVTDSSDTEVYDDLSRGFKNMMLTAEDLARILGAVSSGEILLSDANKTRMEAAVAGGVNVNAQQTTYRAAHNIDLNIWTENKDLTSLIYDMVKHFILGNLGTLADAGIDVLSPVSGRRSGDINVEFGRLLYGANVTLSALISTSSMWVDIPIDEIERINPVGDYYTVIDEE